MAKGRYRKGTLQVAARYPVAEHRGRGKAYVPLQKGAEECEIEYPMERLKVGFSGYP